MPDNYSAADGTLIVGQSAHFYIDNTTALENVYLLNVGGDDISPSGDKGLFRTWHDGTPYVFVDAAIGVMETTSPNKTIRYPSGMPTYVAPVDVHSSAGSMGSNESANANDNLTWIFSVDSGFSYFIRQHFCELVDVITKTNKRAFQIFMATKRLTLM